LYAADSFLTAEKARFWGVPSWRMAEPLSSLRLAMTLKIKVIVSFSVLFEIAVEFDKVCVLLLVKVVPFTTGALAFQALEAVELELPSPCTTVPLPTVGADVALLNMPVEFVGSGSASVSVEFCDKDGADVAGADADADDCGEEVFLDDDAIIVAGESEAGGKVHAGASVTVLLEFSAFGPTRGV